MTVGFFLVRCFNTFSAHKNCVTCRNLDRNYSWPQHFHLQTNVMVLIRILEYLGHIRVSRARNSTIQQIIWIDRNRQSETKQKRKGVLQRSNAFFANLFSVDAIRSIYILVTRIYFVFLYFLLNVSRSRHRVLENRRKATVYNFRRIKPYFILSSSCAPCLREVKAMNPCGTLPHLFLREILYYVFISWNIQRKKILLIYN